MSVHYKFKSSKDIDTITFDGLHISVGDLKKAIINQKRKGHVWKATDFDLQVINAQTKEEYNENNILIPKNTSLIIARVPLTNQSKAQWNADSSHSLEKNHSVGTGHSDSIRGELDLSQMSGTEEDKIQAMMSQSTMDYDPNKYQKIRGQGQIGEVPISYRCFKCHKSGHWIKNCPLNSSTDTHSDHKRVSGIPKSFLQDRGNTTNEKTETKILPPDAQEKEDIPEDLICSICKDLFSDAVMISCCGNSFCDECVRNALLESEDNECPDCKEKGCSPGSLIPNRFLRNSVNNFKNRTGYVKYQQNVKESSKTNNTTSKDNIEKTAEKINKPETKITNDKVVPPSETSTAKKDTKLQKKVEEKIETEKSETKQISPIESKERDPDSDYEDNITVTISPRNRDHSSLKTKSSDRRVGDGIHSSRSPSNEIKQLETLDSFQKQSFDSNGPIQQIQSINSSENSIDPFTKSNAMTGYLKPMPENIASLPPSRPPMPSGPYDVNNYNRMPHLRGYMYNERRPPHPGSYPIMHPRQMSMGGPGPRYLGPSSNLMSVYQGVANKVGTGIIDDPLEAFNRIMREKEKRKEKERRRSLERHRSIERRSRSNERRFPPNRKVSPFNKRPVRNRTPDYKKERERPASRDRDRRPHHYREPERERDRDRDRDKERERERDRDRERDRRSDNYREGKPVDDYNRERDRDKRIMDEFYDRRDDFRDRKMDDYRKDRIDEKRRRRSRSNSFSDRSLRNTPEKRFERSSVGRFEGRMRLSPTRFSSPQHSRHSPLHLRHSPGPMRHSPLHMRNSPPAGSRNSPSGHRLSPAKHPRPSPLPHSRHSPPLHGRHSPLPHMRHSPPSHYHTKDILQRYEEAPPGTIDPPPPGFEFSSKPNYNIWSPNEFSNPPKPSKKDFYGEDPFDMYFPPKEQFDDESEAIYGDLNDNEKDQQHYDEGKYDKNRSKGRSHSMESLNRFKESSRSHSAFRKRSRSRSQSLHKNNKNTREESHQTSQSSNSSSNKNKLKHGADKEKSETNSKHPKHVQQYDENKRESDDRHSQQSQQNSVREYKDDDKNRKSSEKLNKTKLSKSEKHSDSESGKKNKKLKKESRKKKKEKEDKDKKHRKKNKEKKDKIKLQKYSNKEVNKTNTPPKTASEDEIEKKPTVPQEEPIVNEEEKSSPIPKIINEDEDDKKSSSNDGTDETDEHFGENMSRDNDFDLNTSAESGEIIEDTFDTSFQTNNITPLPEPSKWELDDEIISFQVDRDRDRDDKIDIQNRLENNTKNLTGKVTSEVIKRAENAIFTRTTTTIRPIEIKKINTIVDFDSPFDKKETSIKSFTIKHKSIKDRLGPLINPNNLLSTTQSIPTVVASSFDRSGNIKTYDLDNNEITTNKNNRNKEQINSSSNKNTRDNNKSHENKQLNRSRSRDKDKDKESRHRENRIKSRSKSKDKQQQSSSSRRNSFDRRDIKDLKSSMSGINSNTRSSSFNKDKKRGRSPSTDDTKNSSKKSKQGRRHRSRSQRKQSVSTTKPLTKRNNKDSSTGNSSSDTDDDQHQNKKMKHKYGDKDKRDTSRRSSSVDSRKSSKSKKKKKKSSKKKKKSKD